MSLAPRLWLNIPNTLSRSHRSGMKALTAGLPGANNSRMHCGGATADSRKGWGQLVPNNIQSEFILTGAPSPPLLVRILESAVAVELARFVLACSDRKLG